MDIFVSRFFSYLAPLLRLTGAHIPYQGEHIPVTIAFESTSDSAIVQMNRTFHYPQKKPYPFNARLLITPQGDVIELMHFGIAVKMRYSYANNTVYLTHGGYIWRIFGKNIPIPLTILFGKISAQEEALSPQSFSTFVNITHPIFGKIFEYTGTFTLV